MPTTAKGIYYPDATTAVTPLQTPFATLAASVDTALGNVKLPGHYVGTNANRTALAAPDLREGIYFYATDTNLMWFYNGSAWKVISSRPIAARVIKNVAQSTATSATAITWNNTAAQYDTDGMYSTGNNTRLTVPYAGLWRVSFTLKTSGIGAVSAYVRANGTTNIDNTNSAGVGASGAATTVVSNEVIPLSAGDYLEVMHTSAAAGTAFNITNTRFSVEFVGQV